MIFKSNKRKYFTKNKAIDLMVYLSATGANSEKRWRGFHDSTLYRREICRVIVPNTRKIKDIKNEVKLVSPHFCYR